VKRRDLVKRVAREAKRRGVEWRFCREGGNHSIYLLDGMVVPIPRHNEVCENTAMDIFRDCQDVLGKDWWRR